MTNKKVIIIGAGIAGISAAVDLAQNGFHVEVFEARSIPGGRAYSFKDKVTGEIIDNGQHLIMGAYQYFLKLLNSLGTSKKVMSYPGIKVPFIDTNGQVFDFNTQILPGKPGMLIGMLNLKSISLRSRINALDFLISIAIGNRKFNHRNVYELLIYNKQSPQIIRNFWEPLCLAVMNAKPEIADAKLFINVIMKAFFSSKDAARLIFPIYGLSELISPFQNYIENNGGSITFKTRVDEVIVGEKQVKGIRIGSEIKTADYYISAVPAYALNKIFKDFVDAQNLEYSTIVSCYLWFNKNFVDYDLCALLGTNVQWVFNRRKIFRSDKDLIEQFPGHIALTASGANELNDVSKNEILNIFLYELNESFPGSKDAELIHTVVIKDKSATFKADTKLSELRPEQITNKNNFYICGDWTSTGLPATLESASKSGYLASRGILQTEKITAS